MISDGDLVAYLAGTLPEAERFRVERALAEDAELREALWAQMRLDAALRILHGAATDRASIRNAIFEALALPIPPRTVTEEIHPGTRPPRPLYRHKLMWVIAGTLMLTLVLIAQPLFLPDVPQRPEPPVGAILFTKGDGTLRRDGADLPPGAGAAIHSGDTLEAGASGTIVARIRGASITLQPSAHVTVGPQDTDTSGLTLDLPAGTITVRTTGMGVTVKTPHTAAAGSGNADFSLSCEESGTSLQVVAGSVSLSLLDGSRTLEVGPRRSAVVTGGHLTLRP